MCRREAARNGLDSARLTALKLLQLKTGGLPCRVQLRPFGVQHDGFSGGGASCDLLLLAGGLTVRRADHLADICGDGLAQPVARHVLRCERGHDRLGFGFGHLDHDAEVFAEEVRDHVISRAHAHPGQVDLMHSQRW